MRVLVCGSREWTDARLVNAILTGLWVDVDVTEEFVVIEGQCPYGGADALAARWAHDNAGERGVAHLPFPPEIRGGYVQGPARNQRMLDEGKPDVVIAFKDGFQRDTGCLRCDGTGNELLSLFRACVDCDGTGGRGKGGTEDMVRRAKAAGIPVYIVSHG